MILRKYEDYTIKKSVKYYILFLQFFSSFYFKIVFSNCFENSCLAIVIKPPTEIDELYIFSPVWVNRMRTDAVSPLQQVFSTTKRHEFNPDPFL